MPNFKRFSFAASALLFVHFYFSISAKAMPVPEESGKTPLNGEWLLAVVEEKSEEEAIEKFYEPDFKESAFKPIPVPSNWEIYGFETAHYGRPTDSVGYYRKSFAAPSLKAGERMMLHFEGVQFAAEVWLNGKKLGKHLGSYTGFEFDATDAVRAGGKNLLAVKVEKARVKGMDFDCNDAWALSGIYRDVYLYQVPAVHVEEMRVLTDLDDSFKDAELAALPVIQNNSSQEAKANAKATLFSPDGFAQIAVMEGVETVEAGGKARIQLKGQIKSPSLWSAESPTLYPLKVELTVNGRVVEQIQQNVGFREVEVDRDRILINGVPIKFRGVDRHEISVERGRALTTEDWMQDIRLMKAGNINVVRTSHYPPDPEFLDLADRYGLYILDEIPFGYGDEFLHYNEYIKLLMDRAEETIRRDMNHPSVVVWSLGNENPWTRAHEKLLPYVSRVDPTRPRLLPRTGLEGSETGEILPPEAGILAPHYPSPDRLEKLAQIQEAKGDGARPIAMTEFLHSLGRQRWTRQIWDVVWAHEGLAGGFVWLWADQGIKRPVNGQPVYSAASPPPKGDAYLFADSWIDDNHIVDAHGTMGKDGIVDADRTPQPDYYEIKKIYTPIYIRENDLVAETGQKEIVLRIQNRNDFTDLDAFRYECRLLVNFDAAEKCSGMYDALAPHKEKAVSFKVNLPEHPLADDIVIFELRSFDANGLNVDAHQVEIHFNGVEEDFSKADADEKAPPPLAIDSRDSGLTISSSGFSVRIDGNTGLIAAIDQARASAPLTGPILSAWRPLRVVELTQPSYSGAPLFEKLKKLEAKSGNLEMLDQDPSRAIYEAHTKFGARGSDEILFDVAWLYEIASDGTLEIQYEITPAMEEAALLELGVAFVLPEEHQNVTVVGRGPDAYPLSIMNTETSQLGKFEWAVNDPAAAGNKTDVRWVEAAGELARIRFELPPPLTAADGRNFRAAREDGKNVFHFNPWVKHPSKKNSDPPPEYSAIVKSGEIYTSRITLKLK